MFFSHSFAEQTNKLVLSSDDLFHLNKSLNEYTEVVVTSGVLCDSHLQKLAEIPSWTFYDVVLFLTLPMTYLLKKTERRIDMTNCTFRGLVHETGSSFISCKYLRLVNVCGNFTLTVPLRQIDTLIIENISHPFDLFYVSGYRQHLEIANCQLHDHFNRLMNCGFFGPRTLVLRYDKQSQTCELGPLECVHHLHLISTSANLMSTKHCCIRVPDLGLQKSLVSLTIEGQVDFDGALFEQLINLRMLTVRNYKSKKLALECIPSLQKLTLDDSEVYSITNIPKLQTLTLRNNSRVIDKICVNSMCEMSYV
jgi:hypothetical protein